MTGADVLVASGIAAVVVSAAAVVLALRGVRDQLWLQTFTEYTKRFDAAVQALPSGARRPGGDFDLSVLDSEKRAAVENALRSYFNLCSEEHYLHSRKRIDPRTWSIWTTGMQDMFRLSWFAVAWDDMRNEYEFYPEFCAFFDECREKARPAYLDSPPGS